MGCLRPVWLASPGGLRQQRRAVPVVRCCPVCPDGTREEGNAMTEQAAPAADSSDEELAVMAQLAADLDMEDDGA